MPLPQRHITTISVRTCVLFTRTEMEIGYFGIGKLRIQALIMQSIVLHSNIARDSVCAEKHNSVQLITVVDSERSCCVKASCNERR